MPLTFSTPESAVSGRLRDMTQQLFQNGAFPPVFGNAAPAITAIVGIQQLKSYSEPEIITSTPEGYRVLIGADGEILLAADFFYTEGELSFSHSFFGALLVSFVEAINRLTERFASKKSVYRFCCVDFLHAGQPYLAVFSSRLFHLYTYPKNRLHKISQKQFADKLYAIQTSIQPIPDHKTDEQI